MHEMSYVIRIINTVKEEAEKRNLKNISSVKVEVGEMTGALPVYLEKYFKEAAKGTFLEDAGLEISSVPVTVRCKNCDRLYAPDRSNGYLCPFCHSSMGSIISGRDIVVVSIVSE